MPWEVPNPVGTQSYVCVFRTGWEWIAVALTDIDRSLLERTLGTEPGAWKDFVDRFVGLFVHVVNHTAHARSVRLTSDDVDDLCAEIFLALLANDYRVLRSFRGECSLATYLTVVSRRVAVREVARRRKAEALGHVSVSGTVFEQAATADTNEQHLEDHEEVQRLLGELPAKDAAIVRQYHLEGKSYSEISSDLGIPANSIGPTLSRARARLSRPGSNRTRVSH